jgi:hypothetical protein
MAAAVDVIPERIYNRIRLTAEIVHNPSRFPTGTNDVATINGVIQGWWSSLLTRHECQQIDQVWEHYQSRHNATLQTAIRNAESDFLNMTFSRREADQLIRAANDNYAIDMGVDIGFQYSMHPNDLLNNLINFMVNPQPGQG